MIVTALFRGYYKLGVVVWIYFGPTKHISERYMYDLT